ncbi:MAG: radical SAM family heme chaperone HemW [Gemmatimonadota bacterium]|nr:radical SAM family heme chaperone HemW [Gemmatimonadota bacterium]
MHLYLHVPFCARRCSYCDFAIAVRREVPSEAFVDAILAEWDRARRSAPWAETPAFRTIYFGGGTPSRLSPKAITRLLRTLLQERPLAPIAEVTLEANPEDVSAELAAAWKAAGVNRVSLGAQAFDPVVLRWMHRTHGAEDTARAVAVLRTAGITNLSLDLIYALPAELNRDWSADLEQALALEPEHLSLYGLTVEPHTPLGRWVDRGEARPTPDERYATEFLLAHERLTHAGYLHYEVSNYGRPGRAAVHNSAYWRRAAYLGLGPSAHSAAGNRRWWNIREWAEWERAIGAGGSTVAGEERLDPAMVQLEDTYLGLRTDQGLPVAALPAATVARWEREGWAARVSDRVRLTPEGWLRLDALVGSVGR